MASRLSPEGILATVDRGLSAFDWQPDNLPTADQEERAARLYLDGLLHAENPAQAVAELEPSLIRHVILASGIEDHLDILPLLTRDQMTHIMDFEGWSDGQINPTQTARWLQLHRQAKQGELFRRFRDFEEEFQLGFLGPLVEIFDLEAYEELSQTEQDQLHRLPCGEVFYKIKSQDEEIIRFVQTLMEEALSADIQFAYSMLAHAAYMPPSEQEALANQFREARLEEEGFVSPAEAAKIFLASSAEATIRKWTGLNTSGWLEAFTENRSKNNQTQTTKQPSEVKSVVAHERSDLPSDSMTIETALADCEPGVAADLVTGLSHLANTLAVATGLDPTNRNGLRLILAHTKGYCNFGLEVLAEFGRKFGGEMTDNGDNKPAKIVATEHPASLFKVAIAIFDQIRLTTIDTLEAQGLINPGSATKLRQLLFGRKFGLLLNQLDLDLLDSAGVEATEVIKGIFNRFPVYPVVDSSQQKMHFKPVHDLNNLAKLLVWVAQLQNFTSTVKH